MPDGGGFATRAIFDDDPSSGFSCGEPALDDYFARHALTNDRRGIGRAFVLAAPDGVLPRVRGFYTLSMADADRSLIVRLLPRKARHGLPLYPLPVALIGRLAVHVDAQGQHVGETLLTDAMQRVLVAAEQAACVGIIVDAKSPRAEGFYARYTFKTLDADAAYPRRMFVPLDTVRHA